MATDRRSVSRYLTVELALRGWTQAQFARIVNRPAQWVSEVVNGRKALTAESALQLGAAFDSPGDVWLMRQAFDDLDRLIGDGKVEARLTEIRNRAKEATHVG